MVELTPLQQDLPSPDALCSQPGPSPRHPKGLWYLVATEGALAFATFGLTSLFVTCLRSHVLLPSVAGQVWGLGAFQDSASALYGVTQGHTSAAFKAMAGALTALFMAALYAMPLLGSPLVDRSPHVAWPVLGGCALLALGYGLLAWPAAFLVGLALLLLGTACVGVLKMQVGALYAQLNDAMRAEAYQYYSLGVQVAGIAAPILAGCLADIAWGLAFLCSSLFTLVAMGLYALGLRTLAPHLVAQSAQPCTATTQTEAQLQTPGTAGGESIPTTPRGKSWFKAWPRLNRNVLLLLALVPVLALSAIPNEEIFDGYLLWGQERYSLTLLGWHLPVSTLLALDGAISTATGFLVIVGCRRWERWSGAAPTNRAQLVAGALLAALGSLCLAAGSWLQPAPHPVSLWWGVGFHSFNDIGFALIYGAGMALFSRLAPKGWGTTMISLFTMHVSLSSLAIGRLSGLVGVLGDGPFWCLHAAAPAAAAGLFLLMLPSGRQPAPAGGIQGQR
ncbi:MFS transporter [Formicincola oecophyllae]|uniref:MFS transporter n=1 Tax=Formicincola oecophyllae TaxID=2558361 RepID=A0A4Y6U699_9PROT|nr:MFS transporter [Formicincola oecophyllae]QDH12862.1 MFS transporter [Formicincola oecophyllae]